MAGKVFLQKVEHLDQDGVAERVEDLVTGLPADHHLFAAKHGEVLRKIGLLYLDHPDQRRCADLAIAKGFDNGNPGGVREGLKNLSLEPAERIGHDYKYIRKYEYADTVARYAALVAPPNCVSTSPVM